MDDKGIFTTDLLLALVIVTIAMGVGLNTYEVLTYQLQDFTGRQSLERTTTDAADYLVKSGGNPINWDKNPTPPWNTLPGLAVQSRLEFETNYLDLRKVSALKKSPSLLNNLVHTTNYKLTITRADNFNTIMEMNSPNPNMTQANAREVAVANRTVVLAPNQTSVGVNDLTHVTPGHPNNSTYLWYLKGGDNIYVAPGNVTTTQDPNSSFYVDTINLNEYDYYLYIDENVGNINTISFGFTDGDAVVNGTYGGISDNNRRKAINDELKNIYGSNGWQKWNQPDTGEYLLVNEYIQELIDYGGGPDMKLWLQIGSDPKDYISLSLLQVYKGESPSQRIPAKLSLSVWE